MPIVSRIDSLASVAEAATTSEQFFFAVREFLDDFQAKPSAERLRVEPSLLNSRFADDCYADAYLAALAEYLAEKHGLAMPVWALDASRIAKVPQFAFKTPEGRIFLLAESPAAFRARNIFISADALSRV